MRWQQKVFHRVLIMERKEQEFRGGRDVCWEQGDVTRVVLQPEHCQDLSTTLVKVNVAVLERKRFSHLGEGKF